MILDDAHSALDRMYRAYKRGTGCHLTADMVQELGLTFLAEVWSDDSSTSDEIHPLKPTP